MNDNHKKLESLREQLESIDTVIGTIGSEINALEQNEQVRAYLKAKEQMDMLIIEQENVALDMDRLNKESCNHPLYYYMGEVDNYKNHSAILEHPTLIRCTCIKCGKEVIDNSSAFTGKIINVNNYQGYSSLHHEFELLESTDLTEKQKVHYLLKKYNK